MVARRSAAVLDHPLPGAAAPGRPRTGPSRARRAAWLGVAALVLVLVAVAARTWVWPADGSGAAATPAEAAPPAQWQRPAVPAEDLPSQVGVDITRVAISGGGGLVDLRFQVVDPELAESIHDAATPPAVVDERTGLVLHDLLMGHSHKDAFKTGVTYYLIFENTAGWVGHGSKVSVLLGDTQVEHVVVT